MQRKQHVVPINNTNNQACSLVSIGCSVVADCGHRQGSAGTLATQTDTEERSKPLTDTLSMTCSLVVTGCHVVADCDHHQSAVRAGATVSRAGPLATQTDTKERSKPLSNTLSMTCSLVVTGCHVVADCGNHQ